MKSIINLMNIIKYNILARLFEIKCQSGPLILIAI